MAQIHVPRMEIATIPELSEVARQLEQHGAWLSLDQVPWAEYPDKPEVRAGLAHDGGRLAITFSVEERAVLAEKIESNAPVSEDSCVELFLAPFPGGHYYNFEWNCIGTCLAAVGAERRGRELLSPHLIERIPRRSSLGSAPFSERRGPVRWELTALIPVGALIRDDIVSLSGLECTGNLFKCGDHLSVPHYLTWNPISTPRPDFHRPEHFGRILFD